MAKLKQDLNKAFERNTADLKKQMRALEAPEDAEAEEAPRKGTRPTAVSFTQEEYDFIKEVFETKGRGMKVATGIKIATLYIAERLDAGLISMGRAGIIERR